MRVVLEFGHRVGFEPEDILAFDSWEGEGETLLDAVKDALVKLWETYKKRPLGAAIALTGDEEKFEEKVKQIIRNLEKLSWNPELRKSFVNMEDNAAEAFACLLRDIIGDCLPTPIAVNISISRKSR